MRNVTYNQLEKALATLGFDKVQRSNFTAFRNGGFDALIVLPKGTSATAVSPAHLLTVERTVAEKGIVSPDKFSRVIGGVRRLPAPRVVRAYAMDGTLVTRVETEGENQPRRKCRLGGRPVKKATRTK